MYEEDDDPLKSELSMEEIIDLKARMIASNAGDILVSLFILEATELSNITIWSFMHGFPSNNSQDAIAVVQCPQLDKYAIAGFRSHAALYKYLNRAHKTIAEQRPDLKLVWRGRMNNYVHS